MEVDRVRDLLVGAGYVVEAERGIDYGHQLRLKNGAIVNVYNTGKVNVQGRDRENVCAVLGLVSGGASSQVADRPVVRENNRVFVVYGHDADARTAVEAMLRRWGLEPLILDQLPSQGQTIIEKLESYTADVRFAVVLATPDDEGHRAGHPDEKAYRARQNVVLELGMLLAKLGRKRVAILLKEQEQMERPSDIQGLIYIPFKDNLEKEAGLILAKEMANQGYRIDVSRI